MSKKEKQKWVNKEMVKWVKELEERKTVLFEQKESKNDEEPIIDSDGRTYKTIKIDKQEWLIDNLRATNYNDGWHIPTNEEMSELRSILGMPKDVKTAEEILNNSSILYELEKPNNYDINYVRTLILNAMEKYRNLPQKVEQEEEKPNKRIMKNIFHVGYMACHGGMKLKKANKWFDKTYKIEEEEKPTDAELRKAFNRGFKAGLEVDKSEL